MGAQDLLNGITNSVISTVQTAGKIKEGLTEEPKVQGKDSEGIDAKMAAKARQIAQQKINAIYANKELSKKAKTQRIGKIIDAYNADVGGKK